LVSLRDGKLALDLRATTAVDSKARLVTTFAGIPDAAVSSFRMQLSGGKHGILVVTTGKDVCYGKQNAELLDAGHNGKQVKETGALVTPCSATAKVMSLKTLSGGRVRVAVRAAVAGRVVVRGATGRWIAVRKTLRKGQTWRVTLKPSKAARRSLAKKRKLSERVSVQLTAKGKAPSTVKSKAVRLRR
jgi:hypothetical protein